MDQIRLAAWRMRRANTSAATAAATNASGAATGPPVAPISGFWLPCSDWWSLEPVQGSVRGMRFHGQMAGAREAPRQNERRGRHVKIKDEDV